MSYISAVTSKNDFLTDISRGKVGDFSSSSFSGVNTDLDDGVEEDLWRNGGYLSYLTAEETVNIVSTSASDTSPLGVFISGVDANYETVTDVVLLDGQNPVTSAQAFLRVTFMFLMGTGSTNLGIITATASTAATVQCVIGVGIGISQHGFITIPQGKTAIITQIEMNAAKITQGGGTPIIDFKLYARFSPSSAWITILQRILDTAVADSLIIPFPNSATLSMGADVRMSAVTDTNNTTALMKASLILYDS